MSKPIFSAGQIVATSMALSALEDAHTDGREFLARHLKGDWGDLSQEDKRENDFSVREGFRILSAFRLCTGVRVWIITEADRSATTFLLPEEY